MKRIIIVFLALVLVVPLVAQEGNEDNKDEGFKRGFTPRIEIGYRFGFPTAYQAYQYPALNLLKTRIIAGYQINNYMCTGLGVGYYSKVNRYIDPSDGKVKRYLFDGYMPVFADIRVFSDQNLSPYSSIQIGCAWGLPILDFTAPEFPTYDKDYGLYLNSNIGIRYMVSDKLAVNMDIGYELLRIQRAGAEGRHYLFTDNSHAISLNVGFSFKRQTRHKKL